MRSMSLVVSGFVLAVLLVGVGFLIWKKQSAPPFDPDAYIAQWRKPGRYQLVHGKVVDVRGDTADLIMRIDTMTGYTWEFMTNPNGNYWYPISNDPLLPQTTK